MAEIEVTLETPPEFLVEISSGGSVEVEITGTGPQGLPGRGVPTGGLAGQVVTKTDSGEDYATGWGSLAAADDGAGNVTVFFEVS